MGDLEVLDVVVVDVVEHMDAVVRNVQATISIV